MAYPRKIRNAARRLWLKGYSDEKIKNELSQRYPEAKKLRELTVIRWRQAEEWEKDLAEVEAKVKEKDTQKVVDELHAEELRDMETLNALLEHVRGNLAKKASGQQIVLDAKDVAALSSAADKVMRRKRINRYGFDTIQKIDLKNVDADALSQSIQQDADSDAAHDG